MMMELYKKKKKKESQSVKKNNAQAVEQPKNTSI